jgi:hypothetical protein
MIQFIKNIIKETAQLRDDTLKIRGKYSMKRVLVAATFPVTVSVGLKIVFTDVNLAFQVFTAFLTFISVLVGINAYAKKEELKTIENIVTDNNSKSEEEIQR